jgi:hypothetical protein
MIRHGYSGCTACHADPSGGSLLTPYGRAQGELLLRTRYDGGAHAEEAGDVAKFLFGAVELPDSVLLGGDFRAAEFNEQSAGAPAITQWIWMQADLQGQWTIGDRVRLNGSIGYVPDGDLPASLTSWSSNNIISRVHWVGVDLGADRNWMLRAGRMNLPFGIRSIEHTYWVRMATNTDVDDTQEYGVAASYNGEALRGEAMAIVGNFEESPDEYRQRGYSAYVDWAPVDRLSVGLSSLATHADKDVTLQTATWRQAHGAFGRWSPWQPLVLSSEWDVTLLSQPATAQVGAQSVVGAAGMLQADLEVIQGVHLSTTGEVLNSNLGSSASSFGWWGTLWWFLGPHIDLRGDVILQSLPAGPSSRTSATVLLGQVHAYL